jgi:hypothetical protein
MPNVKIFRQRTGLVKHVFILLIGLGPLFNNIKVRLFLQKWLTKREKTAKSLLPSPAFKGGKGTARVRERPAAF